MLTSNFDVFISYSHHDVGWVKDWFLPRLESAGLTVCVDFRDFEVGVPSTVNIENAVKRSRKTILVMTPDWSQSEWTDFESLLGHARDPSGRKGRLIPLLLKDCDLPDRLSMLTYADFTSFPNSEGELSRIIEALRESPAAQSIPLTSPRRAPNLVHHYPLQSNFTGRTKERTDLSAWLSDDEHPIYQLVAMGGMGKSALTWYWLTHDVLRSTNSKLDGVMWWSFYESDSSFPRFIDEALKYVDGRPIDLAKLPSTHDRVQELRRLLQDKTIFFLLDGFERQLRAYARLDAPYREDLTSGVWRGDRSCLDPIAAEWLSDLATGTTGTKVLLTTRLMVRELEDRPGDPLFGVLTRELGQLPSDDAVTFMRAQGVKKGTDAEIATTCSGYGYHPLSLRLLAGLIARDARAPGDIRAAPRHDVHAGLVQHDHHILENSYEALPKEERTLISRIAAFRSPMNYDALAIFNSLGSETRFQAALVDLQVRGLLQRSGGHRYDLHPVVRQYCYKRLVGKTRVHGRLRDYFARISEPDDNKVESIEDLTKVIELFHHTVFAGRYDEARELFRDRLHKPLYYRFAAAQTCVELLRSLFPRGEDHLPHLKDESAQMWTLGVLANAYSCVGSPTNALRTYRLASEIAEALEVKPSAAVYSEAIAEAGYFPLGMLAAAEENIRRSIALFCQIDDDLGEGVCRQNLGLLLAYRAEFDKAEVELIEAQRILDERYANVRPTTFVSSVRAFRAICAMLKGNPSNALDLARESRRWADEVARAFYPNERDIIRAESLIGSAMLASGNDLKEAATHLGEAIDRCRRINLVEFEPYILLAWGYWHNARSEPKDARVYAERALAIAERCEYRLKQADIHNFLARLALDAGDQNTAREHAKIAKVRAWCDGPPNWYKPALDKAEKIFEELGPKE
ncbi:MAG TPA: TIR domain-containing protein [Pyrinomonadaceae bacterium]|nr:TIR domain-containing protein [Pyrinomonadaceae bacterium]